MPAPIAVLLFLAVMVPVEFGFNVGPLFFTWMRLFVFAAALVVLPLAFTSMRLRAFDWLMVAHVAWVFVSRIVTLGPGQGLENGGSYILEVLTVYMMVRLYVRSAEQVLAIFRLLFWLAAIATILAIPEALLKYRFIHEFASGITGNTYNFSNDERLGMLRAASLFEHPILFGMFCAALLSPLWFTTRGFGRLVRAGIVAVGTFFSLSSAPLLVFVAQVGLIGVERTTRWLRGRVTLIALGAIAVVLFLETFSGRGFVGWLTLVMLNPQTAWWRVAQVEYSMDDIAANPLFGIGFREYSRPEWLTASIDNHFLWLALTSGIPAMVFFLLAVLFTWRALARVDARGQPPVFAKLRTGWGLMIVALLLGGATVTYFGRMLPLMAFYIAIGGALATALARPAAAPEAESESPEDAAPAETGSRRGGAPARRRSDGRSARSADARAERRPPARRG